MKDYGTLECHKGSTSGILVVVEEGEEACRISSSSHSSPAAQSSIKNIEAIPASSLVDSRHGSPSSVSYCTLHRAWSLPLRPSHQFWILGTSEIPETAIPKAHRYLALPLTHDSLFTPILIFAICLVALRKFLPWYLCQSAVPDAWHLLVLWIPRPQHKWLIGVKSFKTFWGCRNSRPSLRRS